MVNEAAHNEVVTRLDEVERELTALQDERTQIKFGRRQEAATKLNELSSADMTSMSVEEIIDNSGKVAALQTLIAALTERIKAIDSKMVVLNTERRRLQEARLHGQNVTQFKADVIGALQARRNDILAQLAKVDGELEKMGVAA